MSRTRSAVASVLVVLTTVSVVLSGCGSDPQERVLPTPPGLGPAHVNLALRVAWDESIDLYLATLVEVSESFPGRLERSRMSVLDAYLREYREQLVAGNSRRGADVRLVLDRVAVSLEPDAEPSDDRYRVLLQMATAESPVSAAAVAVGDLLETMIRAPAVPGETTTDALYWLYGLEEADTRLNALERAGKALLAQGDRSTLGPVVQQAIPSLVDVPDPVVRMRYACAFAWLNTETVFADQTDTPMRIVRDQLESVGEEPLFVSDRRVGDAAAAVQYLANAGEYTLAGDLAAVFEPAAVSSRAWLVLAAEAAETDAPGTRRVAIRNAADKAAGVSDATVRLALLSAIAPHAADAGMEQLAGDVRTELLTTVGRSDEQLGAVAAALILAGDRDAAFQIEQRTVSAVQRATATLAAVDALGELNADQAAVEALFRREPEWGSAPAGFASRLVAYGYYSQALELLREIDEPVAWLPVLTMIPMDHELSANQVETVAELRERIR